MDSFSPFSPTSKTSSLALASLLICSSGFAMENDNNNDNDWPTDSGESSQTNDRPSFHANAQQLQRDLVAAIQGNDSVRDSITVGRLRIPSGLFNIRHGNETFINVPQNPVPQNNQVNELDNNNNNNSNSNSNSNSNKSDVSTFEKNLSNRNLQENTLKSNAIPINEDNMALRFLEPELLYERIVNNFHGHNLDLNLCSFSNPQSLLILDALKYTKSVRSLSLYNSHMKTSHYLALATAIAHNRSLYQLNLTEASWSEGALTALATSLKAQKTLKQIILRPKNTVFTKIDIEKFYETISSNRGLRVIIWPDQKGKDDIFPKIKKLSSKNATAALHCGVMRAEGILCTQNFKEAEKFFKKAHDLGHWMANYELAQLKEQAQQYEAAHALCLKSAEQGYPPAQLQMAEYHRGVWPKGSSREPDYAKAYPWCKKAADQDYAEALYRLGRMHEGGGHEGGGFVKKNLDLAAHYFYQAITWGHPDAFAALGLLYRNPDYVGSGNVEMYKQTADYYLEWAKRFSITKGVAKRFLNQPS